MDESQRKLFEDPELERKKIEVIESGDKQTVLLRGQPYMSWSNEDESAPKVAIVQLYELGLVTQEELANAFQVHINSIYNYINTYKSDGIRGLTSQPRGPKEKWKITPQMKSKILFAVLKKELTEYEAIQEYIEKVWKQEISIASIREVLIEKVLQGKVWVVGIHLRRTATHPDSNRGHPPVFCQRQKGGFNQRSFLSL